MVVTVIGELDAATVHRLCGYVRDDSYLIDVLDLRFVPFISTDAVSSLLAMQRTRAFRTMGSAAVEQLLSICDLAEHLGLERPNGPPALGSASLGVAIHDHELRYRYANDALADINGLSAPTHHGRHPTELFKIAKDGITPILADVASRRAGKAFSSTDPPAPVNRPCGRVAICRSAITTGKSS